MSYATRPGACRSCSTTVYVFGLGLGLAFALCGCGGGSTVTAPAGNASPPATVTFTIHVAPDTTPLSRARKPQYSSSAIGSVVLVLSAVTPAKGRYAGTLPGAPAVVAIASGGTCTGAAGDFTCTATTTAPAPATDTWTIYTYADAGPAVGTTPPLSTFGALPLEITVAGPNAFSIATWGIPATLGFSPAFANGPANVGSVLVTAVVVRNVAGEILIGGDDFINADGSAGSVSFAGCPEHFTAIPANFHVANPAALGDQSLSITYDGLDSAGTVLCNATAPGGTTASYSVNLTTGTGTVGWNVTDLDRQP